jgi:hypothetical protein
MKELLRIANWEEVCEVYTDICVKGLIETSITISSSLQSVNASKLLVSVVLCTVVLQNSIDTNNRTH